MPPVEVTAEEVHDGEHPDDQERDRDRDPKGSHPASFTRDPAGRLRIRSSSAAEQLCAMALAGVRRGRPARMLGVGGTPRRATSANGPRPLFAGPEAGPEPSDVRAPSTTPKAADGAGSTPAALS